MKQLMKEPHLLWGALVIVFLAILGFGRPADPESGRAGIRVSNPMMPGYLYTGPSGNYAATPHPGSLTYSMRADADHGVPGDLQATGRDLTVASGEEHLERAATLER